DQKSASCGKGQGNGEVSRDRGLTLVWHRTGHQDGFRAGSCVRHKKNGGANIAVGFGEDMPGIVGLQQCHCAFDFLLRNLANHILREMTLKLTIGSHAIVDTIEQKENHNPDQSTAAKTEK